MLNVNAINISGQTFKEVYNEFKQQAQVDYEDFRAQCNRGYVEFMRQAWKEFHILPKIEQPEEPLPAPPVIMPKEDEKKPVKSEPVPIEEVVEPVKPQPQPAPVAPIREQPQPVEEAFSFSYCGTAMQVRLGEHHRFHLRVQSMLLPMCWKGSVQPTMTTLCATVWF